MIIDIIAEVDLEIGDFEVAYFRPLIAGLTQNFVGTVATFGRVQAHVVR
jgi:hypothetical protein